MTTKKSKRAFGYIALAIAIMLSTNALIAWANSSETVTFENNWDVRKEAESAKPKAKHMDEVKDGDLGSIEEGVAVQSSSPSEVVRLIEETFGEKSKEALAIATCESQLQPDRVGDHHLTFWYNGQEYGKSYGLMQVRSGGIEKNGKIWTRTDNVAQFEKDMKDPKKNLAESKKIYRGDWGPWYNCAIKNNLI